MSEVRSATGLQSHLYSGLSKEDSSFDDHMS